MNIGIDIEQVQRFKLDREDTFIQNTFTPQEIAYAYSKEHFDATLCGLFCAKEALIKTLDAQDILLNEIEILKNDYGKPMAKILKQNFADKSRFTVSISHSGEYATAVVLRTETEEA